MAITGTADFVDLTLEDEDEDDDASDSTIIAGANLLSRWQPRKEPNVGFRALQHTTADTSIHVEGAIEAQEISPQARMNKSSWLKHRTSSKPEISSSTSDFILGEGVRLSTSAALTTEAVKHGAVEAMEALKFSHQARVNESSWLKNRTSSKPPASLSTSESVLGKRARSSTSADLATQAERKPATRALHLPTSLETPVASLASAVPSIGKKSTKRRSVNYDTAGNEKPQSLPLPDDAAKLRRLKSSGTPKVHSPAGGIPSQAPVHPTTRPEHAVDDSPKASSSHMIASQSRSALPVVPIVHRSATHREPAASNQTPTGNGESTISSVVSAIQAPHIAIPSKQNQSPRAATINQIADLQSAQAPNTDKYKKLDRRDAPLPGITNLANHSLPSLPQVTGRVFGQQTLDLFRQMGVVESGDRWTVEEEMLLLHLKESLSLSWVEIGRFFPHRGVWQAVQTRYSNRLRKGIFLPPRTVLAAAESNENRPGIVTLQPPTTHTVTPQQPCPSDLDDNDSEDDLPLINGRGRQSLRRRRHGQMRSYKIDKKSFGFDSDEDRDQRLESLSADLTTVSTPLGVASVSTPPRTVSQRNCTLLPSRPAFHVNSGRATIETQRNLAALSIPSMKISRSASGVPGTSSKKCGTLSISRPYLDAGQRDFLRRITESEALSWNDPQLPEWDGIVLHSDMVAEEKETIHSYKDNTSQDMDGLLLGGEHRSISNRIIQQDRCINRSIHSIEAYLRDNGTGRVKCSPGLWQLRYCASRDTSRGSTVSRCLRARELGQQNSRRTVRSLKKAIDMTFGPHTKFTDTSGDVNVVAWHPNSSIFAAGSAGLTDVDSMQYNKRNNLLLGDVDSSRLQELPQHSMIRQLTKTGPNSSREMYHSQDPLLFASISAVQFSPSGSAMISAGYDNCVRAWDIRGGIGISRAACVWSHKAPVDVIALNGVVDSEGLLATGCQRSLKTDSPSSPNVSNSVKVFRYDLGGNSSARTLTLASPKAKEKPGLQLIPTCLKWGSTIHAQHKYLLGGFSSQLKDFGGEGHVCIWDVNKSEPTISVRGATTVFDATWSSTSFGRFAIACGAGKDVNRGVLSVVKIVDSRKSPGHDIQNFSFNSQATMELECGALDINDVIFNPHDDFIVSVGCTDGAAYLWDLRSPDQVLHKFQHGAALIELDPTRSHEETDTGIRFLSWNEYGTHLYTGSSDGVVARWNPYRAVGDAHQQNVAQLDSGVMSGALSPDASRLLLGEVKGTISVLEVNSHDREDFERFKLKPARSKLLNYHVTQKRDRLKAPGIPMPSEDEHFYPPSGDEVSTALQDGQRIGRESAETGQLKHRPLSGFPRGQMVQGPNYAGPYDQADDAMNMRDMAQVFQEKMSSSARLSTESRASDYSLITTEGTGDNGLSRKRIPAEHSLQYFDPHSTEKLQCFRCRSLMVKSRKSHEEIIFTCESCKSSWLANVLGYGQVKDDTRQSLAIQPASITASSDFQPYPRPKPDKSVDWDDQYIAHYHEFWGQTE